MSRTQLFGVIITTAFAVLIITAVTVLCALHDLDAQAVVALFGAAIGLGGGAAGSLAAVSQTTNGKSVITNGHLTDLISALQEAIHSAAQVQVVPVGEPAQPAPPAG